jgi:hypothetical protein
MPTSLLKEAAVCALTNVALTEANETTDGKPTAVRTEAAVTNVALTEASETTDGKPTAVITEAAVGNAASSKANKVAKIRQNRRLVKIRGRGRWHSRTPLQLSYDQEGERLIKQWVLQRIIVVVKML